MRKLIENMMMVCAPKAHIEQLAGQIAKFRLLDDHIETANMFTEEARHPVKLKGFDLEFHELRVHFQRSASGQKNSASSFGDVELPQDISGKQNDRRTTMASADAYHIHGLSTSEHVAHGCRGVELSL